MTSRAEELAAELQAESDRNVARWAAEATAKEAAALEADRVSATPERVKEMLYSGGRAVVSVRSRKSGKHVTVRLTAKAKNPSGRGWKSRASKEGRVGILDAAAVFADDEDAAWPDGALGYFSLETGEWKKQEGAEANRFWTAEHVLLRALRGGAEWGFSADVLLALECARCGRRLTDPVSVERGVGPECFGKATRSRVAERKEEG